MERSIIIGSADRECNEWASIKELPSEDKFNKAFAMRQEMHKEKSHVIMHANIKTTWKWNNTKEEHGILWYLQQHGIFLHIDKIDTEETVISSVMPELHGTLVCKEKLVTKIREILEKVKVEGYSTVSEWQAGNDRGKDHQQHK
eukprot:8482176-Ditylum_brightwellii.AAC.1